MRQTQNAQKKDNRKSIFVIGLLLLLVAVIGFGGYTLSKYVTKKNASGKASVAKWGFTVSADATNLLGKEYKYNGANSTVNGDQGITVKAKTSEGNIVAPGTTGSMTFAIAGTAEVKAKVEIAFTANKDVVLEYKKGGTAGTYNPVKWTLKKGEDILVENSTLAAIADELNKAVYDETINPGASYTNAGTYTIEWVWAFDDTTANPDADKLDTLLGWTASGATIPTDYGFTVETAGTNTTIDFALNISITQEKQ
ncbi:MAG: hypothetical protein SOV37_03845 [Candidatus Borkfalkiaceae bacterium]|nr:hypothetical protein [Christensenellaceae bacterium]